MLKNTIACLGLLLVSASAWAQTATFSHADSLRGALRPERTCYDVTFYDLKVRVDPATQRISGSNAIHFRTVSDINTLQIDLFENMNVDAISYQGNALTYRRDAGAIFVDFPVPVKPSTEGVLTVEYSGSPIAAARAPWDGGFVWKKDGNGKPYVGVACEGTGASLWWPCKDHLSDEPDSMRITIIAPIGLMAVANGQQRSVRDLDPQWTQTEWFVSYPINNYNVTLNIADYVHFADTFQNGSGSHDLDYYVLRANEEKARVQFAQVKPMLRVYEKYFGEYPFWRDGYALVETSYLGMEHQGAIAYGNDYLPGYRGMDALDLKFDYIIIHETGHEWWGNSVSCKDHAELWIHESFCTYSEAIYVEELWGEDMATRYLLTQRGNILNSTPIVGPLDVNYQGWVGSDMYYKGAWMLHTLRHQVSDDNLWWSTIKAFATEFRLRNTETSEIIRWFNERLGNDYAWLFNEYLYAAKPPVLVYEAKAKGDKTQLKYKWEATQPGFKLKVDVKLPDGSNFRLAPTTTWQKVTIGVPVDQLQFEGTTWYGKLRNAKKK